MFTNLHALPPGTSMFTLFVAQPGDPNPGPLEELDQIAPSRAPEHSYLTSQVILAARAKLVGLYGDTVEVRAVTDQVTGQVIYDCSARGFRPIPVTLSQRMAESFDRPYDAFIDLCQDEHDGLGGAEYLDYLLRKEG